jgi:hypothetical protein
MTKTEILRSFQDSATARVAGYSTLEWLRAFSTAEHTARIARSRAITEREMVA